MNWDRGINQRVKIALIQPPVDERFSALDMTFVRLSPPLGPTILACETEQRLLCNTGFASDIKTYCPPELSDSLISALADCDILGVSTWFSNYENGLRIACAAKRINPELLTIFGGINPTNLGRRVLLNRPEVDLVVVGDGEDVLWRVVAGHDYSLIPNLWYRNEDDEPVFTTPQPLDLNSIGLWNFRHGVDTKLEDYDSRRPGYKFNPAFTPIGLSMTRGCKRSKRCDYCSIPCKGLRITEPDRAWQQIQHLYELYGVESFFETGDDFGLLDYVSSLNAIKPKLSLRFRIYASPWLFTPGCVEALSELGVYEVFLGLETVDKVIAQRVRHPATRENVIRTLRYLDKADMSVCLPFLFGLPGETTKSVRFRINFAREIVEKYSNIRMVLISLAIPLVGSSWFERLCSNKAICRSYGESGANLKTDDVFDYRRLLTLALQHETAISMGEVIDGLETMRSQLEKHVLVGCFGAIESPKSR